MRVESVWIFEFLAVFTYQRYLTFLPSLHHPLVQGELLPPHPSPSQENSTMADASSSSYVPPLGHSTSLTIRFQKQPGNRAQEG